MKLVDILENVVDILEDVVDIFAFPPIYWKMWSINMEKWSII